MKAAKTVDEFILNEVRWKEELIKLRETALSSGLIETIKWGVPAYIYHNKNVMGITVFKSYVALWFHQGALLKDEQKKLINAQEGVTKALRQWRFSSMDEINPDLILMYIKESIQNLESGKVIKATKKEAFVIPDELAIEFNQNDELVKRFYSFTESKQRDFVEYISEAKRKETREQRLEKIIPLILEGIGLNDKYKK
jgi:uncharacterized protein YdeI (YjbR/CyaY-like superfamily)